MKDKDKAAYDKVKLIKDALTITNVLADLDIDDKDDLEIVESLIKKAKGLKKSIYWNLT